MAVIKLTIQPDKASLEATVNEINNKLKEIKGLQIRVDNSGAQAAQSLASNLQKASSAAMEYDHRLDDVRKAAQELQKEFGNLQRIVGTTFSDETKQFTQAVAEFGRAGEEVRRVAIAFDEAGEATHSLVSGTEDVAAASKRAARESEKAAKEAEKAAKEAKRIQDEENRAYVQGYTQREKEVEKIQREKWNSFLKEVAEEKAQQEQLEQYKVKQAQEANRQLVKDEEEAQRKRTAAWKAYFDGINGLSDAKTKQGIEDNRRAILDEEEAQRKRTAAWKAYFDQVNEVEKQNAAELEAVYAEQRKRMAEFLREQAQWEAQNDAEQHRKNAEAIQFEAEAQRKLREEQERANKEREKAADTAVTLERQYSNLIRQIQNLKAQYPEGTFDDIEQQAREARDELRNLDQTSATYAKDVERLGQKHQGLQRDLANTRQETQKLDKVTESFWMNIQKFARWYIGGNIVTKVIGGFRDALATMKEVDTELANIQKVTDRTTAQMKATAEAAYDVASAYGVAAQDYLESVGEFAKAGFGDMSEQLAEIATKTQLVGDVTSSIANKFLIASNAAWEMNGNVDRLNQTLDAANVIENNYATSIEKLAQGMPIVASIAAQAGMTFEETIAALGTITAVTQETGTKSSTALRALILNIIGAVGEYEDGIEVTEESVKSLDGILQVYAKDALAAAKAAGTVINPMEAIAALAKASEEGLVNQAELFEVLSGLGGKLRTNQLTALVQNYDMFLEMLDKTTDSAGSAEREIAVMLDTWEAKTNILKNTWTEFVSHLIDTGIIKDALDTITKLIDFLDTKTGTVTIKVAALSYVVAGLGKGITNTLKETKDLWGLLEKIFPSMKGITGTAIKSFGGYAAIAVATTAATVAMYNALTTTEEEYRQATEEATSAYDETLSEYNELCEKADTLTETEKIRLSILKQQLSTLREERYTNAWQQFMDKYDPTDMNKNAASVATQYRTDYYHALTMARDESLDATTRSNWLKAAGETEQKIREMADSLREYSDLLGSELPESGKYALVTLDNMIKAWDAEEEAARKAAEEANKAAEAENEVGEQGQNSAPKVKTLTERMADASEAATKYDTAIGEVITAMTDFGAGSIEVYNAMVKLEAEIPGSTDKLYDFSTATWKIDASLIESKGDLLDFIDTQKQLEFSSAISQLEQLSAGYWDVAGAALAAMNAQAAQQMAGVLAHTGVSFQSGAGLDNINTQLAQLQQQKAEWDAYIATLRARSGYRDDGSGNGNGGGNDGGSQTTTDEKLAKLQKAVELRKAELAFLQASGAAESEIDAKQKEIQAALHAQAEYMRSIGADEADILALSTEWWNIQNELSEVTGDELERLKSVVSLRKSELEFLEASGASEEELNAKRKEIQAALHAQAEYMRSIGADEADILALSTEWWNIQNEIKKKVEETAKATGDELARLQGIVSYQKQELSFLEASGASVDEQNAKRREIQASLHAEAEYLRGQLEILKAQEVSEEEKVDHETAIRKLEEEILALSTEWWNIQEEILRNSEQRQEIDQTELGRLQAILTLRKQELAFLQASGASEDELNAKRKEIQAALHDEAEERRRILALMIEQGASEEEIKEYEAGILALSTEWWNIQEDINASLEKQKQIQREMFDELKSIVDDYYAKLISEKQEELSLEEKILAVQKAEADLANAQRERTVRYYNAATGQWEWQANAKNVKSAQDALKRAQDDLNKYQRDQAWKEFKSAWEYVSEQIKSGAMTFREAYDYMYAAMKGIQDKYGVDLGMTLEDSIGGFKSLNYGIDGLTQEVANSLGASVGVLNEKLKQYETAVDALRKSFDEVSEKVKSGEMTMEDAYGYLRDRAKEIADRYGIDMTGALDEAIAGMDKTNMSIDELWKSVIINLMKVNSARWFDASDEEKAMLHAQNEYLGNLIGATYDPSGYWYLNGSQLYGSQRGVDYSGKTTGYGSSTGGAAYEAGAGYAGAGGGYGSGGGAGSSSGAVISNRGAGGTGQYYDSYGNTYATLGEAVAGNAAIAASKKPGTRYYGKAWETVYNKIHSWTDPQAWAEYSQLAEANPEYAAKLMELEQAVNSGAPQSEITAMINSLYTGPGGSFGSFRNGNGTTGWVKAGNGNANGEHLLILNGQLYQTGVNPGTMLQDLWGNRWKVGEDGQTLTPIDRAWEQTDSPIAPGGAWDAIMNVGRSDLSYMDGGAIVTDSPPVSAQTVDNSVGTQHNGNVYNFSGIQIGEQTARTTTVHELAEMAGMLGTFSAT